VVWNNWLILFPSHWECHYPNWRTHIFQRDRYTTNQWLVGGWSTTLWTIGNDHSSYDSWIIHDVWQFRLFNVRPSHSNLTAPRNHGGCKGWNHIFGIIEWGHVIWLIWIGMMGLSGLNGESDPKEGPWSACQNWYEIPHSGGEERENLGKACSHKGLSSWTCKSFEFCSWNHIFIIYKSPSRWIWKCQTISTRMKISVKLEYSLCFRMTINKYKSPCVSFFCSMHPVYSSCPRAVELTTWSQVKNGSWSTSCPTSLGLSTPRGHQRVNKGWHQHVPDQSPCFFSPVEWKFFLHSGFMDFPWPFVTARCYRKIDFLLVSLDGVVLPEVFPGFHGLPQETADADVWAMGHVGIVCCPDNNVVLSGCQTMFIYDSMTMIMLTYDYAILWYIMISYWKILKVLSIVLHVILAIIICLIKSFFCGDWHPGCLKTRTATEMAWFLLWTKTRLFGLEHGILWFSHHLGNVIIPTDELIFFRGVGIPPTRLQINASLQHSGVDSCMDLDTSNHELSFGWLKIQ